MATLDNLPADQRAVLQLVLQQGRSYDDIAKLLSIDRAAVRQRALSALDALGPQTGVPPERRALITDYLLGQLPPQVSDTTRDRLAQTPTERAWARVVASELAPFATHPLPDISAEAGRREPPGEPVGELRSREPGEPVGEHRSQQPSGPAEPVGQIRSSQRSEPAEPRPEPPSSRRGGALLLGLGGLAVVAAVVVVIVLVTGGSGAKHTTTAASTPAATSTPTTTGTTSTTATRVLGQINLSPPSGGSSQAKGIAEVLAQGKTHGIAIVAQGVSPNTKHDAYAVWLYNSSADAELLGFVNPGVGTNGRISTASPLPTNASHFKQLVVTLETQAHPKQPGTIVLQGPLSGVA